MKNKVLLLGNGINNIQQDYRWIDLIHNLINFIGATGQIEVDGKPFPLLYEEIFVEAVKNRRFKESDIKDFIAQEVARLEPNDIHQKICALDVEHILTTNYDLTLEKVLTTKSSELKNNGIVKENIYSLFRHYSVNNKKFWHIHGDANLSGSITLGYEHYSGYLQLMRNYVAYGTGNAYKTRFSPLLKRLKKQSDPTTSWVDFFFTRDIYIVGLTLDFIELHLWWLLTFRQRIKLLRRQAVKNHITYFFPDVFSKQIKHKLDLLRTVGVTPFSIAFKENQKAKFYHAILKKIEK